MAKLALVTLVWTMVVLVGCNGGAQAVPTPIADAAVSAKPVTPAPAADQTPEVADGVFTAQTFPADPGPGEIIFDGEHIWVAHQAENIVSKWSLDGTMVASFASAAGPRALAFDGENIWVGNSDDNSVTKLSQEGDVLLDVRIGSGRTAPSALVFDGHHIWVAAAWGNSLTKLSLDGVVQATVAIPGFHPSPWALVWDGEAVWVASMGIDEVHKVDRSGNIIGVFQVTEIPEQVDDSAVWAQGWAGGPTAMEFDGENIWLLTNSTNTLIKLSTDGRDVGEFEVTGMPMRMMADGQSLWVTKSLERGVVRLALDGTPMNTYSVDRGPFDLAFDGEAVWVTNFEANTVTKLVR